MSIALQTYWEGEDFYQVDQLSQLQFQCLYRASFSLTYLTHRILYRHRLRPSCETSWRKKKYLKFATTQVLSLSLLEFFLTMVGNELGHEYVVLMSPLFFRCQRAQGAGFLPIIYCCTRRAFSCNQGWRLTYPCPLISSCSQVPGQYCCRGFLLRPSRQSYQYSC